VLRVVEEGSRLRVETPAKINVGLRLLAKRPDGYHELESVVMAVTLTDTLEAEATPDGSVTLEVRSEGAEAPADESNLVMRAARRLQAWVGGAAEGQGHVARSGRPTVAPGGAGARLVLTKRIPARRGLGGGSSDGAAALVLLNRLWGLDLRGEELSRLAAELGSDVPFFLNGPLAVMRGRGDIIEPIDQRVNVWVVLLCPPFGLATRDVYQRAEVPLTSAVGQSRLVWSLLVRGRIEELGRHLVNDLEPAAQALNSDMSRLRRLLEENGAACVSMAGSGSAMYALCATEVEARTIAGAIMPGAGAGVRVLSAWMGTSS